MFNTCATRFWHMIYTFFAFYYGWCVSSAGIKGVFISLRRLRWKVLSLWIVRLNFTSCTKGHNSRKRPQNKTVLCLEGGITVVTHWSKKARGAGLLELQHRDILFGIGICRFDIMPWFCNVWSQQSVAGLFHFDASRGSIPVLPQPSAHPIWFNFGTHTQAIHYGWMFGSKSKLCLMLTRWSHYLLCLGGNSM